MPNPVKRDININKKPYSCPVITVYGTVKELTQTVNSEATAMGDHFRRTGHTFSHVRCQPNVRSASKSKTLEPFGGYLMAAGQEAPVSKLRFDPACGWNRLLTSVNLTYAVFGLLLRSNLPIPGLIPVSPVDNSSPRKSSDDPAVAIHLHAYSSKRRSNSIRSRRAELRESLQG